MNIIALPETFVEHKKSWLVVAEKILIHYQQDRAVSGVGRCIDLWKIQKDIPEEEIIDALGFILGELIIESHGGEWVFVEDKWGKVPAIRKTKTSMITFVLDVVSKRLRDIPSRAEKELPTISDRYAASD